MWGLLIWLGSCSHEGICSTQTVTLPCKVDYCDSNGIKVLVLIYTTTHVGSFHEVFQNDKILNFPMVTKFCVCEKSERHRAVWTNRAICLSYSRIRTRDKLTAERKQTPSYGTHFPTVFVACNMFRLVGNPSSGNL